MELEINGLGYKYDVSICLVILEYSEISVFIDEK